MKILITALLSAALIWLTSNAHTPVNNSEPKVVAAKIAGQAHQEVAAPVKPAKQVETPAPQAPAAQPEPLTDKEQLMQQAGIPRADWAATDYIVTHESSWNPTARNSSSGAYGLCQSLPASKMASVSGDYMNNPVTQLKWCHQYAVSRYGGWWSSFAFWRAERWW